MDRDYMPEDLYEQGWRICRYSDEWHFNDEMALVGREIQIGVWKNDDDLGLLRGDAWGSDLEETIRDAVSKAS